MGTFDGNGKTISKLKISEADDYETGLFGAIVNDKNDEPIAVIKNLAITNADVVGGKAVGILAGSAENVHIEKVYVSGKVSGTSCVGGMVGSIVTSRRTITNCYSRADVSGLEKVGGLVGEMSGSTMSYSYAAGKVELIGGSTLPAVGGLLGVDVPASESNGAPLPPTITTARYQVGVTPLAEQVKPPIQAATGQLMSANSTATLRERLQSLMA